MIIEITLHNLFWIWITLSEDNLAEFNLAIQGVNREIKFRENSFS